MAIVVVPALDMTNSVDREIEALRVLFMVNGRYRECNDRSPESATAGTMLGFF